MKVSKEGNRTLLHLEGKLTVNRAAELREILHEALGRDRVVAIDLAKVESMDLSCLQLLCAAHRTAVRDGKSLTVIEPRKTVLGREGLQAGFVFQKSCRYNQAQDCLWLGGVKNE